MSELNNIKEIPLTQSEVAIVSERDFRELSKFKWHVSIRDGGRKYAVTHVRYGGKDKALYMHNMVHESKCGLETDHINGNGLDNRRENLRSATRSQNCMNQKIRSGGGSKYKGVSLRKRDNTWLVQIMGSRQMRSVVGIKNEEIAGLIYDILAYDSFGEFAVYNFPEKIKLLTEDRNEK